MIITIRRGTHQVGGCVTEISSGNSKVFIDFGADLPGSASGPPPKSIPGLTVPDGSRSALFFTHYHGDHVGRLRDVHTSIPMYIGQTAKKIYYNYAQRVNSADLEKIDGIKTYLPDKKIKVGDITVTPFMVDHSAFDAYMFVIEADGKRILHTGDFRLHGFRGAKTIPMLKNHAPDIDCIICETTNLSREEQQFLSERELQTRAKEIMRDNQYVFVMCSSTNIDRIAAFYHANPRGRLFVCSGYQKKQLETVRELHKDQSQLYDFSRVYDYGKNLDALMEERGFCVILQQNSDFAGLLKKYKGRSVVFYSMWTGYLEGEAKNEELADFLRDYELTYLHSSGHAYAEDIVKLYHAVNPKTGLIPIHGETPEKLAETLPDGKIFILHDGESLTL